MLGHDELLNFLEFILSNFCGRFYKNSNISLLLEILVCYRAMGGGQTISIYVISYEYLPFHFNKTSMYHHHQRRRFGGTPTGTSSFITIMAAMIIECDVDEMTPTSQYCQILMNPPKWSFQLLPKIWLRERYGVIIADNKTNFRINDCGSILM